jgi:hypothetical protein
MTYFLLVEFCIHTVSLRVKTNGILCVIISKLCNVLLSILYLLVPLGYVNTEHICTF